MSQAADKDCEGTDVVPVYAEKDSGSSLSSDAQIVLKERVQDALRDKNPSPCDVVRDRLSIRGNSPSRYYARHGAKNWAIGMTD